VLSGTTRRLNPFSWQVQEGRELRRVCHGRGEVLLPAWGKALAGEGGSDYHALPFLGPGILGRRGHECKALRFCMAALEIAREADMASYSTNEFKSGLKILIDGDPYVIVENEMVKPGKGQAFNRVRVRNLKTGRTVEKTWKSGDSVEAADVMDVDMQYLYQDGEFWHFMVPENFEQYAAGKSAVGDAEQWLKDGVTCIVTLWNGVPLVVTPPQHIEATIV